MIEKMDSNKVYLDRLLKFSSLKVNDPKIQQNFDQEQYFLIGKHYQYTLGVSVVYLAVTAGIVDQDAFRIICCGMIALFLIFSIVYWKAANNKEMIIKYCWTAHIVIFFTLLVANIILLDKKKIESHSNDTINTLTIEECDEKVVKARSRWYLEGFITAIALNCICSLTMNWFEELFINLAVYILMMILFADDSNLPMQIGKIATGSAILLVLKHQQEYRRKCVFILKLIKKQKLSWYKYIVQSTSHSIILMKAEAEGRNLDIIKQNKRFSVSFSAKPNTQATAEQIGRVIKSRTSNAKKSEIESKLAKTLTVFSDIILGHQDNNLVVENPDVQKSQLLNVPEDIKPGTTLLDFILKISQDEDKNAFSLGVSRNEYKRVHNFLNCTFKSESSEDTIALKGDSTSHDRRFRQSINQKKKKIYDIKITEGYFLGSKTLLIVIEDISDSKLAIRQRQMFQYQKKLMNSLQHNLKTPLNAIQQFSVSGSLRCASFRDDQISSFFQDIQRNTYILSSMLQQIQFYNKSVISYKDLQIEAHHINDILQKVSWVFETQFKLKNVKLIVVDQTQNHVIINDSHLIEFILCQFLENALKFSPSDQQVILQTTIVSTGLIKFTVEDEGPGLKEDQILKILEGEQENYQSINQQPSYVSGSGLGLSICKKIIQIIGPREQSIEIKSVPNEQTCFSFKAYADMCQISEKELKKKRSNLFSQSLMWIEDEENVAGYYSQFHLEQRQQHLKKLVTSNFRTLRQDENSHQNSQDIVQKRFSISPENEPEILIESKQDFSNSSEYFEENAEQGNRGKSNTQVGQYTPSEPRLLSALKNTTLEPTNKRNAILQKIADSLPPETIIMIVDDMPYNIIALKATLQDLSPQFRMISCSNGQEAINKVKELHSQSNPVQRILILMDINMPVLDGIQATQKLKKSYDLASLLTIIIVSAYNDTQERFLSKEVGSDGFISKPFQLQKLADILQQIKFQ